MMPEARVNGGVYERTITWITDSFIIFSSLAYVEKKCGMDNGLIGCIFYIFIIEIKTKKC